MKSGQAQWDSRADAMKGWAHIIEALVASDSPEDQVLSQQVARFLKRVPFLREAMRQRQREQTVAPRQAPNRQPSPQQQQPTVRVRPGPEIEH